MPKFMKVAGTDELDARQAKLVEVEGQKIGLFRVGAAFHALSDTCTLEEGRCPKGRSREPKRPAPGPGRGSTSRPGRSWGRRRDERSGATRCGSPAPTSRSKCEAWTPFQSGGRGSLCV